MTVLLFYIPTRNGLEKVADKFFYATVACRYNTSQQPYMKIRLYFRILFTSTRNFRGISGVARPRVALDKLDNVLRYMQMYPLSNRFITAKSTRKKVQNLLNVLLRY